jgi:N-acyl-D-amino-acid deacylase
MPLEEAIRRLTRLPAQNWKLEDRGCLEPGCYGDLVVFDPEKIQDHATYERPQQYAPVSAKCGSTACRCCATASTPAPNRVVRGPGWSH